MRGVKDSFRPGSKKPAAIVKNDKNPRYHRAKAAVYVDHARSGTLHNGVSRDLGRHYLEWLRFRSVFHPASKSP